MIDAPVGAERAIREADALLSNFNAAAERAKVAIQKAIDACADARRELGCEADREGR